MSKYKDVLKNGWHPERSSGTEKSGIRGQVKIEPALTTVPRQSGMLGRNKSSDSSSNNHVAAPLTSLRDPSSFAPPPKRTGTGLAPPPPPSAPGTRKVVTAPSKYIDPRAKEPPAWQQQQQQQLEQEQGVEDVDEDRPPQPYRVNTSGLSTDNLPKPPSRRDTTDARPAAPPSYESTMAGGSRAPPPKLPPRLPPRTNTGGSSPGLTPLSADGDSSAHLNQGAINRLGAAGISVPAFGIGRPSPASPSPPPPARAPAPAAPAAASPVNELQNRFSKLRAGPSSPAAAEPPAQGTTWQQKQSALNTVSAFNKDPSSVSMADARSAASTANNFRQRHGEQIAAGVQTAQKYGVADRAAAFAAGQDQGQGVQGAAAGLAGKKKPPPPPPKKKVGLGNPASPVGTGGDDEPPPIPMSTRPTF
ncbi:hypothetical protein HJFPF1_11775 [Paramyrothecium foliicola]|nr:hypothetical protein HJFPF1_11775 [Paramyrothecium foliicola]